MAEIQLLTQFFKQQGGRPRDEFLSDFPGAFLMARFRKTPPVIVVLPKDPGFELTVGSDDPSDLEFEGDPTLDPVHLHVAYHAGFRGWTVEDRGSSFGTQIDGERVTANRATLLSDGVTVRLGGGMTELQFYLPETLYGRMNKAGITRSLSRKRRPAPPLKQGGGPTARPTPAARPAPAARPPAPTPTSIVLPPTGEEGEDEPTPVSGAPRPTLRLSEVAGQEATLVGPPDDDDGATPVAGQPRP